MRAAKAWEAVVELCELRLAVEDDVERRLALLAEIARIEEIERRDVQRAFAAWARALTEDATVDEPREALERLAAREQGLAGAWPTSTPSGWTPPSTPVCSARWRCAWPSSTRTSSPISIGPPTICARRSRCPATRSRCSLALERVLRKLGKGSEDELGQVLAREAELAGEPATQADFLAALGTLRLGPLDDPEGALSAFRDAVERDPGHAAAHDALHQPLDRPETRGGGARRPRAAGRDARRLPGAGGALRPARRAPRRARRAGALAAQDRRRLRRAARSARGRAGGARARAQGGAGGRRNAGRSRTDRRGPPRSRAAGARKIEEALADAEPDAAQELALRAARLYQAAGDRAAAERLYRRVLDHDAENADALTALEGLYRAGATPAQLAAVLERRSASELDPQVRRTRLLEAARLYEGQGDLQGAIASPATAPRRRRGGRRRAQGAGASLRVARAGAGAGEGLGGPRATHRRRAPAGPALVARRRAAPRAAQRSRRRGGGLPRGARGGARRRAGALGAGVDRGPPRRLVDAAGGPPAPAGQRQRRRPGGGAAQAGPQRRAEALGRRSSGGVPAPAARHRSGQRLRLPRARAHPARRRALV